MKFPELPGFSSPFYTNVMMYDHHLLWQNSDAAKQRTSQMTTRILRLPAWSTTSRPPTSQGLVPTTTAQCAVPSLLGLSTKHSMYANQNCKALHESINAASMHPSMKIKTAKTIKNAVYCQNMINKIVRSWKLQPSELKSQELDANLQSAATHPTPMLFGASVNSSFVWVYKVWQTSIF